MKILIVLTLLISVHSFGNEGSAFAGKAKMNGYSLDDFPDFDSNWRLVTVRFRTDKKEMRFTYANEIAYQALISGTNHYPDGSVFAKIGALTSIDPKFASSEVPSGTLRYQLMVKDSKKHKQTDGWGYALFDTNKVTFPENPKVQELACHACHKIMADRGFVFSEKMNISPFKKTSQVNSFMQTLQLSSHFKLLKRDSLTAQLQNFLPKEFGEIYSLEHDLRDNLFQGTLDEIVPTLIQQTKKTGKPSALLSRDEKRFSLIYPDVSKSACREMNQNGISFKKVLSMPVRLDGDDNFQAVVIPACEIEATESKK